MLSPYEGRRMTDGLHGAGRMMGDPKFHQHGRIEAAVADRWRREAGAPRLGEATLRLAERFGYDRPAPADGRALPPLVPAARDGELPLAHAQERLWFIERLERGRTLYTMPGALRLRGELSPAALAASLAEIARRHETLRTRFVERDGRPVQVIDPPPRAGLPLADLSALPPGAAEGELGRLLRGAEPPLDLARGPLVRAALVRAAPADHVLLVTLHHLVADGWSIGLLLRELMAIYPALRAGRPSPLPELAVQYADFAVWQRGWLRGEVLAEQLAYWRRQLAGLVPLSLPADRPAAAPAEGRTFPAGAHEVAVEPALAARLHGLAQRYAASPFMVLLAAFQALLHRHSGQPDLTVGAPIAGRNRAELESLIGFFVNTLVLRSRLGEGAAATPPDAARRSAASPAAVAALTAAPATAAPAAALSFGEHLARVRETVLGAYGHQDVPFAMVVEALHPDRRRGVTPLFDAMFTLQNQPATGLALPGLAAALVPRAEGADARTQFALVATLRESAAGFGGT